MQAIVVGSTVKLTSGETGKIVEFLHSKAPAWERKIGDKELFLDSEFTMDNVEKWGAELAVEVGGRRRYLMWLDINASTIQAPEAAAPQAQAPKLHLPTQGKAPPIVALPSARPKLVLKPVKPN